MYKSPIEIMQTGMQVQMENGIMKAVQDVGINVDKSELLKALAYDREQYQKGFEDGREAGREWISFDNFKPQDGQRVLSVTTEGEMDVHYFDANWENCLCKYGGLVKTYNITHWMPLPEPP